MIVGVVIILLLIWLGISLREALEVVIGLLGMALVVVLLIAFAVHVGAIHS